MFYFSTGFHQELINIIDPSQHSEVLTISESTLDYWQYGAPHITYQLSYMFSTLKDSLNTSIWYLCLAFHEPNLSLIKCNTVQSLPCAKQTQTLDIYFPILTEQPYFPSQRYCIYGKIKFLPRCKNFICSRDFWVTKYQKIGTPVQVKYGTDCRSWLLSLSKYFAVILPHGVVKTDQHGAVTGGAKLGSKCGSQ